jgi:2-polyprenyl-6-hydroxyphenyl methylase / 3-demethylubiquinone-9 3-methyltransferase
MKKDTSIIQDEIEKFSSMAEEWWDPNGKLKTLHDINPLRLSYINNVFKKHSNSPSKPIFKDLKLLDVGCGGGILSEPLARLGGKVTSIDASQKNIEIAKAHSKKQGLKITYINTTVEDLSKKKNESFDIIFCLEIIEHVNIPEDFLEKCITMLKPGGIIFISTMNRTIKSYLLAIIGAEYLLKWLPIGTHSWEKFLKPSEINSIIRKNSCRTFDVAGMEYNPLKKEKWFLTKRLDVNYILTASKD